MIDGIASATTAITTGEAAPALLFRVYKQMLLIHFGVSDMVWSY
jgi:hypothetical protein